ncbi:MAG TPA: hypothetical protein VMS17_15995 [Gemmataceae bacterium]|nr:hypothetical protein [Gemmataceae bacterium]
MRRFGWRLPPAAVGLLLLAAASAPAQQPPNTAPSFEFLKGTQAFRRILYDSRKELFGSDFKGLRTLQELDDPQHTLLIVFGDLGEANWLQQMPIGLAQFVQNGGALFLATDKPLGPAEAAVLQLTGFRVSGDSMVCTDGGSCYRGMEHFPWLKLPNGGDRTLFHGLVVDDKGISRVATNAPSFLQPDNPFAPRRTPRLGFLPAQCRPEGAGIASPDPLPFGVGGDVGGQGGRILLLADHSIFINEMIMQTDNDNLNFSYNCLKWAAGGPQRSKVLFIEDGRINATFDVPLREMPDELAQRLLDFLGAFLERKARDLGPALEQKARLFDSELAQWCYDNGTSPYCLLLIFAAVWFVVYGCWKVGWKARYRTDLQGPLLAMALYRVAPTETVAEQRRLAQIRGDNVWEQARDTARQWLEQTGATGGSTPPSVVIRGGWLQRWRLAGRVRRMWRLAFGPPVRVRLSQLPRLAREAKELQAAFADGTIQFK